MMKKSTAGFTLIELVVGILCAVLITGVAGSLMLMGLRNSQSLSDANTNLQNSRIILTMVEQLASEGVIQKIDIADGNGAGGSNSYSWLLLDEDENTILSYSAEQQAIYTGDPPTDTDTDTVNNPLMAGVTASTITISNAPLSGNLLNFSITTDDGRFETVAYCRASKFDTIEIVLPSDSGEDRVIFSPDSPSGSGSGSSSSIKFDGTITGGRTALLSTLLTQYGSHGEILDGSGKYFSSWYNPGWTHPETAWCACFVSWGVDFIYKAGVISPYLKNPVSFAHVQTGWDDWAADRKFSSEYDPEPGDLIFFDWGSAHAGLDHVGVVLYDDANYIYTIEGNSNATEGGNGRVAIQRYARKSSYIHGYAVLDWANP